MTEQKYGIKAKPASSGNPQTNETTEIIHQVLGNIVHSYNLKEGYIDDADPRMGILAASSFTVRSRYHQTKQKSPGQLVFERDMILTIYHMENCR